MQPNKTSLLKVIVSYVVVGDRKTPNPEKEEKGKELSA